MNNKKRKCRDGANPVTGRNINENSFLYLQKIQKIGQIMLYGGQQKIRGFHEHVQHWISVEFMQMLCYILHQCIKC